jgi:hypothetical protein
MLMSSATYNIDVRVLCGCLIFSFVSFEKSGKILET